MYGVVDVGYGSHTTTTRDGSGSIKSSGVMDGGNAGNRIGFRGTEDLGGGLKANFVVEQGISPTNGSMFGVRAGAGGHQIDGFSAAGAATGLSGAAGGFTTATNRQAYLGVSTGMGTVNIGYQYTNAYELATLSGYALGSEGVIGADKSHLHGLSGSVAAGTSGVGGTRANMISYISPAFSGFTARVQYGTGTGRESFTTTTTGSNGLTTDNTRRMGLMLQYANGPLSVAAAYTNLRSLQENRNAAGVLQTAGTAGATSVYGVPPAAIGTFNPGANTYTLSAAQTAAAAQVFSGQTRTANLFQLGGSYDFGVAKIGATYNTGKDGGNVFSPASTAAGTAGFERSYKAYQIGVSVPFGALVPYIAIGRATTDVNNPAGVAATATAAATGRVEDYKQLQIGARYSLSKRTTAYAMYGRTTKELIGVRLQLSS
jgi:predicted porin